MIGLLTALWRRPELSALVQRYYLRFDMLRVAVRSSGDPQEDVPGWSYVEAPNDPLGAKWNAGLQALRGVEAVMIVGSDDLVSEAYVEKAIGALEEVDVVQNRSLWVWQDRLVKIDPAVPGAGRVVSKKALDKTDWTLWEETNRYLDGYATRRLQECYLKERRLDEVILDIKTEENLWRLDGTLMRGGGKTIRYGSVEEKSIDDLPEEIRHALRRAIKS